jgi:flagellar FliJ protein
MAKQSTDTLKMLIGLAERDVNLAAEALAQAMKVAEDAQSKQNMLHEYRQAYIDNLNKASVVGIGAEAYTNYQNFFGKLDQAISGQMDVVASAKRLVQKKREMWQETQRKKLSYEVLMQRSDKQAYKAEQKRDQKSMDEFSTRISRSGR